jgi:hypothetical protein
MRNLILGFLAIFALFLTTGCLTTIYGPMSGANIKMPVAQAEAICRNENAQAAHADTVRLEKNTSEIAKSGNTNAWRVQTSGNELSKIFSNISAQLRAIKSCMAIHGFEPQKSPD